MTPENATPESVTPESVTLWQRLAAIRRLSFQASSSLATGWNGSGQGEVEVSRPAANTLIFSETGHWQTGHGNSLRFQNVYRWSRSGDTDTIRLEHLRFGTDQPVYLFDLRPVAANQFASVLPHSCGQDSYAALLLITDSQLQLDWSVTGPEKDETIGYIYS